MATRTNRLSAPEPLEDRLVPAGGLDALFGTAGKVTLDFNSTDTARAVAVQTDGRIVTAGAWDGGFPDFAVARFTPAGNPNPTFGGGFFGPTSGKTNVFFGNTITSGSEVANAVAVQDDGKIVVAGYTNLNGGAPGAANDFAIARLNADGSPDTTFGSGGKVVVDFSPVGLTADDRANALWIQPDGAIVVAGSSEFGGIARFAFARLDKLNGSLDGNFSGDGKLTVQVGDTSAGDFATALARQDDGKIVAVGYTDQNGTGANPNSFAVVRLNETDGSLDGTFDGDGKKVVDFGFDDRAAAVTIQRDGRILVAGSAGADFALVRFNPADGSLDTNFGANGKKMLNVGGLLFSTDVATGVAVQRDGKIVVGGYTKSILATANDFAAARLSDRGELDTTFGLGGVRTVDFGGDDRAYGLALRPDGRVVLAGGNGTDFAVARLMGNEVDLSVTVTNNVTQVTAGGTVTYAITVTNTGPDAVVYEAFGVTPPPALGNVEYSVNSTTLGASASPDSGADRILGTLVLPAGGSVTYTLAGTVSPTATGTLDLGAAVPPQQWFDANPANNFSNDSDPIVAPSPGNFSLSAATYTVAENGGTATITVNRVGGAAGEVSVRYRTRDLTATAGSDYAATSGTLTWANGDTAPKTFTIPITDDALAEEAETVEVYLDSPSPGTALATPFTGVLTITDNDPPAPPAAGTFQFSSILYSVTEGGGPRTITVNRVGGSAGAVTVKYATVDNQAIGGSDYVATSGTLSWADGDTAPKTFTVVAIDDALVELSPEFFRVQLSDPTGGATIAVPSPTDVVVNDNDTVTPPPTAPVPQPALVGGAMNGSAVVLTPSAAPYSAGSPVTLIPGPTNVRVATADVNGDGVPDRIAGAGPGGSPTVVVVDGKTGATLVSFPAFESSFTGGVYVAAADIDGDGKAEVVVTPDQGGGPVVAMYSGAKLSAGLTGDAAQLVRFFGIADPAFRGGARPALGDLNGDGAADLAVAAGFLGGPRVALFNGRQLVTRAAEYAATGNPDGSFRLVGDFFAYESGLRNGSFVAIGDVTGDGKGDLAFGAGPDGAPRVRVFDGAKLLAAGGFVSLDDVPAAQVANFFAGDASLRGSVRVALRDADGDAKADLLTGSGEREASRVRVYKAATLGAATPTADQEIDPFAGAVLANGVFVG